MARIRYLKPDFFKDEDLAELPFEVRLFFAGLWNFADKSGRLEERPKRLKVEIFPYDKVDIEKCLKLLSKPKNGSNKPFIQRYAVENEHYIQIVNWEKHQKPHHTESDSKIPPAPPMEKGTIKEKGMEKQLKASKRLRNGEITVKEPLKTQHLEFVYLTKEQHQKLLKRFGDNKTEGWIDTLNNYIGKIGVKKAEAKYRSHYHTILSWANSETKKGGVNAKGSNAHRGSDTVYSLGEEVK